MRHSAIFNSHFQQKSATLGFDDLGLKLSVADMVTEFGDQGLGFYDACMVLDF